MDRRIFPGLLLVSLLIVTVGGAHSTSKSENPVWTMESMKVKPGMFGITLGYLDDNWMRIREEAKRQGAVLSYQRIAEEGSQESDREIVLLTEYKNQAAYEAREKLFSSIRKEVPNNRFVIGFELPQRQDLYDIMNTRVFQDYSDIDSARFRLLSKD
jgi:ribosomal protein S25